MEDHQMRFANKHVLVTGATGYIGGAIAEQFLSEGAIVEFCGLSTKKFEALKQRINSDKAFFRQFDICNAESIEEAFRQVYEENGSLDILVNCAGGGSREETKYLRHQSIDVIDRILNTNLRGTILCTREALNYMNNTSKIVNISSIHGEMGFSAYSEYAAAKGGIIAFTKSMAKELGHFGITVNCVCPGNIPRDGNQIAATLNYLNILPNGTDCAGVVLFLTSEEARFITGAVVDVDGGRRLALCGSSEEYSLNEDGNGETR